MVSKAIECPTCGGQSVVKHGKTETSKQRYLGQNPDCNLKTFVTDNAYKGRLAETKAKIVSMSINGSGIRDIARVLEISPATVISASKKNGTPSPSKQASACQDFRLATEQWTEHSLPAFFGIYRVEIDARQSFVGQKQHPRWLWHAIDHDSGEVLA